MSTPERVMEAVTNMIAVYETMMALVVDESIDPEERNKLMGVLMDTSASSLQRVASAAAKTGTMTDAHRVWFRNHAIRILELIGAEIHELNPPTVGNGN